MLALKLTQTHNALNYPEVLFFLAYLWLLLPPKLIVNLDNILNLRIYLNFFRLQ
jgi:hypothetical protein